MKALVNPVESGSISEVFAVGTTVQKSAPCVECGAEVKRQGSRGRIPERCLDCSTVRTRQQGRDRYARNAPTMRSRARVYYEGHRAEKAEYHRSDRSTYYQENRDRILAKARLRREAANPNPRICRKCSNPTPSRRRVLCDPCRGASWEKRRLTSAQRAHQRSSKDRGYGGRHAEVRRSVRPRVDSGLSLCARCDRPIPAGGNGLCPAVHKGVVCGKNHQGWDLGHDDQDRSQYTGPEHVCCNRRTSARVAAQRSREARGVSPRGRRRSQNTR